MNIVQYNEQNPQGMGGQNLPQNFPQGMQPQYFPGQNFNTEQ